MRVWIMLLFLGAGCATFNSGKNIESTDISGIKKNNDIYVSIKLDNAVSSTWYSSRDGKNRDKLIVEARKKIGKFYCVNRKDCPNSKKHIELMYSINVINDSESWALISLASFYLIPYVRTLKLEVDIYLQDKGKPVVEKSNFSQKKKIYFHLLMLPLMPFKFPSGEFHETFMTLTDKSLVEISNRIKKKR